MPFAHLHRILSISLWVIALHCIRDHGGADHLIHLAGYCDFSNNPHPEYEMTNIGGTKKVLQPEKLVGI